MRPAGRPSVCVRVCACVRASTHVRGSAWVCVGLAWVCADARVRAYGRARCLPTLADKCLRALAPAVERLHASEHFRTRARWCLDFVIDISVLARASQLIQKTLPVSVGLTTGCAPKRGPRPVKKYKAKGKAKGVLEKWSKAEALACVGLFWEQG
eukprot:2166245-Pleurochrysis_carterae.AAC.2